MEAYICHRLKYRMKKLLIIVAALSLGFAGCLKSEKNNCVPADVTLKAIPSEVVSLQRFITKNAINAQPDERGFFYKLTQGTGNKPTSCSNVTVDYVAKLGNGTTVDSANNISYPVSGFISGWREALPLIASGGNMTLYLPPSLGYGNIVNGNVPANSYLIF